MSREGICLECGTAVTVIIPFSLPGLNEYIEAERSHRQKGAAMKRKWQKAVAAALLRQLRGPLQEPVIMRYTWYERDRRRDKDNISAFGRKVIQDAMVRDLRVLKNDGWANIESFSDRFRVSKLHPRIEIEIEEAKHEAHGTDTVRGRIRTAADD